jgi:hydrogenase maturation factor
MGEKVLLAHGSGGKLSHELIAKILFPSLANPLLAKMDDSAVFNIEGQVSWSDPSSSPVVISASWQFAGQLMIWLW